MREYSIFCKNQSTNQSVNQSAQLSSIQSINQSNPLKPQNQLKIKPQIQNQKTIQTILSSAKCSVFFEYVILKKNKTKKKNNYLEIQIPYLNIYFECDLFSFKLESYCKLLLRAR